MRGGGSKLGSARERFVCVILAPCGVCTVAVRSGRKLRAVISVTGEMLNPQVINTTVNPGLAQAALEAVRQWRYEPTLLNGQPVEVVTNIDVTFELDQ